MGKAITSRQLRAIITARIDELTENLAYFREHREILKRPADAIIWEDEDEVPQVVQE